MFVQTLSKKFGQDFEVEVQARFEAGVWSVLFCWCFVECWIQDESWFGHCFAASASVAMALWSWIGSLTSFLHTFCFGKWQFWVWTMIQFFVNVISFCEWSKVKVFTSFLHMYCFGNFENLLSYVCLIILWNQKCLILSSFQINCLLCHFVFVWRFLTSRLVQL